MRRSNRYALSLMIVVALSAVSGCNTSDFDMDLRQNQYGTSDAARGVLEKRPKPDSRGIITYPNYQVAIAKFGDTLEILANRIGVDAQSLANYNGVKTSETLRPGEVIALPGKIAESRREDIFFKFPVKSFNPKGLSKSLPIIIIPPLGPLNVL